MKYAVVIAYKAEAGEDFPSIEKVTFSTRGAAEDFIKRQRKLPQVVSVNLLEGGDAKR